MPAAERLPGALVLSLDFELHWGVRDREGSGERDEARLLGARAVIPRMLELFEEFEVAATWATVGLLFARDRDEMERYSPELRPRYEDPALDPYSETVGADEVADPLHFGGTLIERIRSTPRQEIGTQTFSHFYCHEPGQDLASFEADLAAARAIAAARGIELRSIVFPRNQHNSEYDPVLLRHGITAYRGLPDAWFWRLRTAKESRRPALRAGRFLDHYLNVAGAGRVEWGSVVQPSGLADVAASAFLRGFSPRLRAIEPLRERRLGRGMAAAARDRSLYHLWWHPHNFGDYPGENLGFLRRLLERFRALRREHGMISVGMAEAAELAPR